MKRVDKILKNELYLSYTSRTDEYEKDRRFCRHDLEHFLAVARIAQILNLKGKHRIEKEWIYAAALLHDIGRFKQYEDGTPHAKVSAALAPEILEQCGFHKKASDSIIEAIRNHGDARVSRDRNLSGILYRADKLSRSCFACPVRQECDWKGDKKNLTLKY